MKCRHCNAEIDMESKYNFLVKDGRKAGLEKFHDLDELLEAVRKALHGKEASIEITIKQEQTA